jgi:hypothetical protein
VGALCHNELCVAGLMGRDSLPTSSDDVPVVDEEDIRAAMEKMKTSNPMDILNGFIDNDDAFKLFEDKEQMVRIAMFACCVVMTNAVDGW